jgi:hypothetical protein
MERRMYDDVAEQVDTLARNTKTLLDIVSRPDWMRDFAAKKAAIDWRVANRGYSSPQAE